ncbi:MAG: guanine permease [Verrucomicrobiales bacterium]|nr:guanine permease [Verrucomicrobiales bacterium]
MSPSEPTPGQTAKPGFLERRFQLGRNGTTVSREIMAGLTTFAAMAYILVVNPSILQSGGMPQGALVTATAVGAAVATLLMAFMANLPLALAPGMGINAFFAYTVCLGMGVPWQDALGLVLVNGVLFLLLSVTGVRAKIVAALPHSLKAAVCAGIGLFIAFIGLKNGGLVVTHPVTLVTLGDLSSPPVALFAGGLLLTCVLVARGTPAAILISMAVITLAGLWVPDGKGGVLTTLPHNAFSLPASLNDTFLKLRFHFLINDPFKALPVILTLLLVDMFDNIGTLIGVTKRAGLMDQDGNIPKLPQALAADSLAAIASALLGTSTVVSYIESATGVQAGGRTGLTGVTVAVCFLLALFLTPVILMIPAVAVAPALVVVGILMFESVAEIDVRRFGNAVPAVLTLMIMPVTFSISTGIGMGLIALVVMQVGLRIGRSQSAAPADGPPQNDDTGSPAGSGSPTKVTPFTCALAMIFVLHFLEKWIFQLFGHGS